MMLSSPAAMAHPSALWLTASGRVTTERTGEIAQRWMEMVLGEKFTQGFPKVLLSGECLCSLANRLFQALGMRDRSCASMKTSWPSALSVDSLAAMSTTAVSGSVDELEGLDGRRSSERARLQRDSSDIWLQQKRLARENVEEYLRACEAIGVPAHDSFEPEDLLELQNLDKVYKNILALQNVAVSISHRRSIDDRSSASLPSMSMKHSASPVRSMALSSDSFVSSSSSVDVTKDETVSWEKLLAQYEKQHMKNAAVDQQIGKGTNSSQTEGLGKLAHDLWRTEEHIRAQLLRDDGHAVPVPDKLHGKLWMLASGAGVEMRRQKDEYQRYVAMEVEPTDATRQIDADLHRTVGDSDKQTWTEAKTAMMRRVLVAYSFFNPTLGYCQGLNYIVARLLLYVGEEEAFYLLVKMIRLVPDDYYTTMLGLAVDQHVFADLVRLQAPTVAKRLEELGGSGMELSLACTEWFLTLFSSPCAKDVTVHIWDLIFLMGDEILFRVALSLLDLEKEALMNCTTYGDMLRHLNEIGRRHTDGARLMLDAQKKDTVSRLRIDDFRAHHRLQLATGIAVQSAEDISDSNGDASSSAKDEAKEKLFGSKKRAGLFKQLDKSAGRVHRTFDRLLTDDYSVSLQKEHPTFSCYYDGRPPIVFDMYWGSAASKVVWGRRNYRRITEATALKEPKEERRRLQSDGSGLVSSQKIPSDRADAAAAGRASLGRERRSKSIAFIQPGSKPSAAASQSLHRQLQQGKTLKDDETQFSRSPKNWLQRIEGWHKDLKIQKEKKKAEKLRSKLSKDLVASIGPPRSYGNRDRGTNHTFTTPSWRHIDEPDQQRGNSFDLAASTSKLRQTTNKRSDSMDVNVSNRSHSDPFLSPTDAYNRASWHETTRNGEDIDGQIRMRSNESDKSDFTRSMGPTSDRRRSGSHVRGRAGSAAASGRLSDVAVSSKTIDIRARPLSKTNSFSTSALTAFDLDATDESRLSFDMGRPPAPVISDMTTPVGVRPRRSSVKSNRAVSADIDDAIAPTGDLFDSLALPNMRRNQSLPLQDAGVYQHFQQQQQHNQQQFYTKHMRKVTPDAARVIRERAQVLSYMQRKASDASSLAGSFPLTPSEHSDALRASGSSSDSSQFSEFLLPTNRSAAVLPPPLQASVRKSSFSFFDKLSSDLETHLDDLHGSFIDDAESRESFDSSIFSRTWSPSSAHQKILAATSGTD